MNYEFGDIFDCRDYPSIKHFILVLGVNKKDEIMYYRITSKVYKVFKNILDFFNDCIERKYRRFFNFFGKEKNREKICLTGNLCDAFFLDQNTNYCGYLDVDSMILINSEPELMERSVLDNLHKDKFAKYCARLCNDDSEKIIHYIRLSKHISVQNKNEIGRNYNSWKKVFLKNKK